MNANKTSKQYVDLTSKQWVSADLLNNKDTEGQYIFSLSSGF